MLVIAGVGKFFSISPVGDKMVTSIKIVNMPVLGRILGDPHSFHFWVIACMWAESVNIMKI